MPIEPDPKTLFTQAQDHLAAGDYQKAREMFTRVLKIAGSRSNVYRRSEIYMWHLGDNDEAESFQLLKRVARARSIYKREDLLTQALEKGLEFTLPDEQNLEELLKQVRAAIRAEQEAKARDLMAQGDEALEQRDLQKARQKYEEALALSNIGSAVEKEIRGQFQKCESEIALEAQLIGLLSQADEALNQARYVDASELVEQASRLRPVDARLAEPMQRAQAGMEAVHYVEDKLAEGRQIESNEPWRAVEIYEAALEKANELGLSDLSGQADLGRAHARDLLRVRAERAAELVRQAEDAFAQKDLEQAIQYYEEALKVDPNSESAIHSLAAARQHKSDIDESKQLKKRGKEYKAINDWAAALEKFQAAKLKNPDDPELDSLIEEASQSKLMVDSVLNTVKHRLLPYETPSAMFYHVRELSRVLTTAELNAASRAVSDIFRQEAANRFQEYLQVARIRAAGGDLDGALEWCRQIDRTLDSLSDEEKENSPVELVEVEPGKYQTYRQFKEAPGWRDSLGKFPDIRALNARFKILEALLADLELAHQIWLKLRQTEERGEKALADGKYDEAVKTWREVLRGLETSPEKAHYLLGKHDGTTYTGVWERSRQRFVEAARGLALQLDNPLRQAIRRAETHLSSGDAKGALELIDKIEDQADELKRVKVEYDAITKIGWPLTEPLWEVVEAAKRQVESAIRANRLLDEAREHLSRGELSEAESRYREVPDIPPYAGRAKDGLQEVVHLRQLVNQQEEASNASNVNAEHEVLLEITRLAPGWEWANRRLEEVKAKREEVRLLDARRGSARQAQARNDADTARRLARQVLDVQHDDELEQIVTWADSYQAGKRARDDWKKQGRAALKEGRFSDALGFSEMVLSEDDTDVEAARLRERAQDGLAREREARELLQDVPPNYADAVRKLSDIPYLTGAQSGDWVALLNEAQDAWDEAKGMEALLEDLQTASQEKRWLEVLQRTKDRHKRDHRIQKYFRQAVRAIRESVTSAVDRTDWAEAAASIRVLRAAGLHDDEIEDWDRQCRRADLLRRARLIAERGSSEELEVVITELGQSLHNRPDDREVADVRRQAQIALLRQQADLSMSLREFESAAAHLRKALGLKPDLEVKGALQAELDKALVEIALIKAEAKLRTGDAQAAGEALEEVKAKTEDTRVMARLGEIKDIRAALAEANILEGKGDIAGAVRKLDEVLKLQSDFPPALKRRRELIADLLNQGRQAEVADDLWSARKAYETLHEIAPQEQTNLEDVRRRLDGHLNELSYRVRQALENPDLEQAEAKGLLESLESIPQAIRQSRMTLNQYVPALRNLLEQVRKVDDMYLQARSAFDEAHQIGEEEYTRIQHLLDSIRGVNGLFARRGKVRELQRGLDEHRARRSQVAEGMRNYRLWWTTWKQPVVAAGADFSAPVQKMLDEAAGSIDDAMRLNREIKSKDDQNLYGLREWPDPSVRDPLNIEYEELAQQKANLENIANLLLDGIKQRELGNARSQAAQKLYDESAQDGDYAEAKTLWDQAATTYELALNSLKAIEQHAPLSTRARALAQDAASLAETVERRKEETKKQITETANRLDTLARLRANADQSYGRREWALALIDYDEIWRMNPRDSEAIKKRSELERRIRDEHAARARKQRNLVLSIGGAVGIIVLLLAVWHFGFGPGRPLEAPTPTATLPFTPVAETPRPAATTPEATRIPVTPGTPSPEPSVVPILYQRARSCQAPQNVQIYSEPDEGSASQTLESGKTFSAIGETSDGKWLIVQLPGYTDPRYVLFNDAQCTP